MNDSQQTFILDARYAKTNFSDQLDRIESKLDDLLALLAPKQKRTMTPKDVNVYPVSFEEIWDMYPKRAGNNSKKAASSAYRARVKSVEIPHEEREKIKEGVKRYMKFCLATGKVGTEYVKQMSSFLNQKCYLNDFAIPAQKVKVPADNDEMLKWAIAQGMRQPREGESWQDYRRYVTEKVAE